MIKSTVKVFFLFLFLLIVFLKWPGQSIPEGITIDEIIVFKQERRLEIWSSGNLVKSYAISLGKNPTGPKREQGDSRTPEGLYTINDKNPNSRYHLNLGISYPSQKDLALSKNPGGNIKIHGLKNGFGFVGKLHRFFNWTDGCIAVTNEEIEELYEVIRVGTTIEILK